MIRRLLFLVLLAGLVLTACGGGEGKSAAVQAMEAYMQAFNAKDYDTIAPLTCKDWELQAFLEIDSFQGVETQLQDMVCSDTGTDGDKTLVQCTGKIIASYGNEKQEFDMSLRTYELIKQSGNWLVCGYR
jgi:hypothetical protein